MIGATPATIDEIALQHAERDAGGDPGIDRVAACLQDVESGGRGQVMPGRDGVAGDGDGRSMGGGRHRLIPPRTMCRSVAPQACSAEAVSVDSASWA